MAEFETYALSLGNEYHVSVDKVGGGTIGQFYTGDWKVTVIDSNPDTLFPVYDNEIVSTGMPHTHSEVVDIALDFLAAIYDND